MLRLLRNNYRLESLAANGSIAAADALYDLEQAIRAANITMEHRKALLYVYGLGVTQEEAAKLLGLSQTKVSLLLDEAVTKIADVFQRWKDEGVKSIDG